MVETVRLHCACRARGGPLPFLPAPHNDTIAGDPGTQVSSYLAEQVVVPASTLQAAQTDFSVP